MPHPTGGVLGPPGSTSKTFPQSMTIAQFGQQKIDPVENGFPPIPSFKKKKVFHKHGFAISSPKK